MDGSVGTGAGRAHPRERSEREAANSRPPPSEARPLRGPRVAKRGRPKKRPPTREGEGPEEGTPHRRSGEGRGHVGRADVSCVVAWCVSDVEATGAQEGHGGLLGLALGGGGAHGRGHGLRLRCAHVHRGGGRGGALGLAGGGGGLAVGEDGDAGLDGLALGGGLVGVGHLVRGLPRVGEEGLRARLHRVPLARPLAGHAGDRVDHEVVALGGAAEGVSGGVLVLLATEGADEVRHEDVRAPTVDLRGDAGSGGSAGQGSAALRVEGTGDLSVGLARLGVAAQFDHAVHCGDDLIAGVGAGLAVEVLPEEGRSVVDVRVHREGLRSPLEERRNAAHQGVRFLSVCLCWGFVAHAFVLHPFSMMVL